MIDAEGIKSLAVIGVGIVSTVLLNLIIVKQNQTAKEKLLYEQANYEDEFPFPVPDSIYADVGENTPKRNSQNNLGDLVDIDPPPKADRRMSGDHALETDPLKAQTGQRLTRGSLDGRTLSQISNIKSAPVNRNMGVEISEIKGNPEVYPSNEFTRRNSQEGPGPTILRPSSPGVGSNPKGVHTFTDSSKSSLGSQVTSDVSMSTTSVSWVDATVEREPFDYDDEEDSGRGDRPSYKSE